MPVGNGEQNLLVKDAQIFKKPNLHDNSPNPSTLSDQQESKASPRDTLQIAKELAERIATETTEPLRYSSIEEALHQLGLSSQRARFEIRNGMPYAVDTETQRARALTGTAGDIIIRGPAYLTDFQSAIRWQGKQPVTIASYSLTDRYAITIGLTEPYYPNGESIRIHLSQSIDSSTGVVSALYLQDKTAKIGGVIDLKSIISPHAQTIISVDEHDLRGERLERDEGITVESPKGTQLEFRLITTPGALGTLLHEGGHAIFHQALRDNHPELAEEFLQEGNNLNIADTGELTSKTKQRVLIDETTATAIGKNIATSLIEDNGLAQQVNMYQDSVVKRYETALAKN